VSMVPAFTAAFSSSNPRLPAIATSPVACHPDAPRDGWMPSPIQGRRSNANV
jgi:hypothetical protein